MNRFIVSLSDIQASQITIRDREAYHLKKVLRLAPGDKIQVADGQGNEYLAAIIKLEDSVICQIIEKIESVPEPEFKVALWQGIPKGEKMDFIIQKCTELGISRINPLYTKYTVVRLEPKKQKNREERWQRIAFEAAKQCGRAVVPSIGSILNWQDVLAAPKQDGLFLLFAETQKKPGLKQTLENNSGFKEIHLLVGPEGGFAEQEINTAQSSGWYPVSLGRRILRTETAGMAGLTMVLYQYGQLGG